jgi:uncharacterized protein (TIGR02246 family)
MKRVLFVVALGLLVAGVWFGRGIVDGAVQEKAANEEEKAIRRSMEEFVNAFNVGDAKALGGAFTVDAEYVDDEGNGVRTRAAITKLFEEFLTKNKGAKLQLTLDGLRLVAPNVALEDGESVVTVPDKGTQSARRYAMTLVKQDGKWLLGSVREFPETDLSGSDQERLKELEWMIGDWIDEGGDAVVLTSARWSEDKRYLLRDFTVKVQGKDAMKGTQRIGVDPLTGQIRAWVFDTAGGHGEAAWFKNGEGWLVKATGVSSDGDPSSATYVLTPQGKDRIQMKAMHRVVGETVEPDLEVTLVRKPPQPK